MKRYVGEQLGAHGVDMRSWEEVGGAGAEIRLGPAPPKQPVKLVAEAIEEAVAEAAEKEWPVAGPLSAELVQEALQQRQDRS